VCTKAAVIDNELYRSPSIQLSLTGFVQLHFDPALIDKGVVQIHSIQLSHSHHH